MPIFTNLFTTEDICKPVKVSTHYSLNIQVVKKEVLVKDNLKAINLIIIHPDSGVVIRISVSLPHYLKKMIELFTDGASSGNPGPGGFGAILRSDKHYKEISAGYRLTTNNRMELLAVIVGLEAIKKPGQDVMIYSDSKYVIDSVEKKWVFGWVKKAFAGKKNKDLWIRFLAVYKFHQVKFTWIKGHAGHVENERCDVLAVLAARQLELLIDSVFEIENRKSDLYS